MTKPLVLENHPHPSPLPRVHGRGGRARESTLIRATRGRVTRRVVVRIMWRAIEDNSKSIGFVVHGNECGETTTYRPQLNAVC
jgi:hypothetical protein